MSEERLGEFLRTGNDWEKLKTSIPGVFIQKLPPYRSSPARLAIEVNPVDSSPRLLELLDKVNPGSGQRSKSRSDDVIVI
jgi:hypothetical protein